MILHTCMSSLSLSTFRCLVDRGVGVLENNNPLTPHDVAHEVHDVLLDALNKTSMLHPRIIIASNGPTTQEQDNDWLRLHLDALVALMVSCFLLLELCPISPQDGEEEATNAITLDPESCRLLERTIQRCMLLLRIILASIDTTPEKDTERKEETTDTKESSNNSRQQFLDSLLPLVRYQVLQSALQELPLDEFLLHNDKQQDCGKTECCINAAQNDTMLVSDEPTITNDSSQEEDDLLAMDKEQLALEEIELIDMAQTPIDNVSHGHKKNTSVFARQGPMVLQNGHQQHVLVRLARCGLLCLEPRNEDSSSAPCSLHKLVCSLNTGSSCRIVTTSFSYLEINNILSYNNGKQQYSLKLMVPNGLVEACAWVNVVNHMISTTMKGHEELQQEIVQSWDYETYSRCHDKARMGCNNEKD